MRGHTLYDLNGNDYDMIMDYLEGKISEPCIQDKFLEDLCTELSRTSDYALKNNSYAISDPVLMYPYDKYSFVGNYREIVDSQSLQKIRAYFDCPLDKSPLFLLVEDINILPITQLFNSVASVSKKLFKSTKFSTDSYPIVVQIDLENIDSKNTPTYRIGTLKYHNKKPEGMELFDVYDSSIIDLPKMLPHVYGIDFEKTHEELLQNKLGLGKYRGLKY